MTLACSSSASLALLLLLLGCSSGTDGDDPSLAGSSGGAETSGSGGATGSGGSADSSGSGGSADSSGSGGTANAANKTGSAFFLENFLSGTPILQVYFSDGAPADRDLPTCTTVHETGGCSVRQCPATDSPPDTAVSALPHAGVVTYESSEIPGAVSVIPDENGAYGPAEDTRDGRFGNSFPAVFTASGGDVPSFQQPLAFPLRLILDEPVLTNSRANVPRDQDLVLTWRRGEPGMRLRLQGSSRDDEGWTQLHCNFDAEAGTATVPSELLRDGPASGTTLPLIGYATTTFQAGDYHVTLSAGDLVVNPELSTVAILVLE